MSIKEQGSAFGTFAAWAIGVGVVLIVMMFMFQWVQLPLVNKQTQINRASNGYITAQQEALADEMAEYRKVDLIAKTGPAVSRPDYEAQEQAIINQMRIAAAKIPGYVPSDVAELLQSK